MREAGRYDEPIRHAILRLRGRALSCTFKYLDLNPTFATAAGKYKLIALTNNFSKINIPQEEMDFLGWSEGATPNHLRELFDDFCDSSTLGMRLVD